MNQEASDDNDAVDKSESFSAGCTPCSADCTPWIFPALDLSMGEEANKPEAIWNPTAQDKRKVRWPTAQEVEAIRKAAYDEGFSQGKTKGFLEGKAEGLKAGAQDIKQKVAHLSETIAKLMSPIDLRDEEVTQLVLDFILSISKNIIKRELNIDSSSLKVMLSEAAELLPLDCHRVKIKLNPQDLELIKSEIENFPDYQKEWKLVGDGKISQGGCMVETETLLIDATIEKRIADLTDNLFKELAENKSY